MYRQYCGVLVVVALVLALGGCGGSSSDEPAAGPPDATRAARQRLPDHNPEARFGGRTVLEYAQGLNDLNPRVQFEALSNIAEFGVDGLPARDLVRDLVNNPRAEDFIRLAAIGVLHEMQAPEATPLAREKLMDPGFSRNLETYQDLLDGLIKEAGLDVATLRSDLLALARTDLDHATRLMMFENMPTEAREALIRAVFEANHGQQARDFFLRNFAQLHFIEEPLRFAYIDRLVESDLDQAIQLMTWRSLPTEFQSRLVRAILAIRDPSLPVTQTHSDQAMTFFFQNMAQMDFLEPEEKYQFVADNSPYASRPNVRPLAHQVLLSVATRQAMRRVTNDLVTNPPQKYRMMIQFAQAGVDPIHVHDEILRDVNESTEQRGIGESLAYLELLAVEVGRSASNKRAAGLREHFIKTMREMIADGSTEMHRALAAAHLVSFVGTLRDIPITPALDPVFAVLRDESAPEIVRGTAGSQLQESAAALAARDGFIERTVAALWEGEDVNATHFPEQILIAAASNNVERSVQIIDALARDVDAHLEGWAINSAAIVLMNLAANTRLNETAAKEQASIAMGKIFASPHARPAYLNETFNRTVHRIWTGNRAWSNTLDGLIGLIRPTLLAEHDTVLRVNNTASIMSRALANPDVVGRLASRSTPEARARYAAFLQEIADLNDHSRYFSSWAANGVAGMAQREERGWYNQPQP